MEPVEECLLKYRHTLRRLLAINGVASNPGVTDDWILEKVSELLSNPTPLTIESVPDNLLAEIGKRRGWDIEQTRKKIAQTKEILELSTVEDAIVFLSEALPIHRQS